MTTKIEIDENSSASPKDFETISIDLSDYEFERIMRAAEILKITIDQLVALAIKAYLYDLEHDK